MDFCEVWNRAKWIGKFQAPPGGGGDSHIKVTGVLVYLLGVKNAVLLSLRVFSFKKSLVVASSVYLSS